MTIVSQINAINLKFKISTIADKLLRQKQIHLYVYQYRCYNINDTTIITGCDNINDTTIITGCYNINDTTIITGCDNINDTTIITGCDNINDTTIITGCDNDYFVQKKQKNKQNKTTTNK